MDTLAADDLAAYLSERFETGERDPGEALEPLLSLAAGHPQRAMMLAHHLWAQTARGKRADTDTWSRTLSAVGGELQGEFEATWARLTAREQRLVTAIADNRASLFSRETRAAYGIAKTGSHRGAIEALRDTDKVAPRGPSVLALAQQRPGMAGRPSGMSAGGAVRSSVGV